MGSSSYNRKRQRRQSGRAKLLESAPKKKASLPVILRTTNPRIFRSPRRNHEFKPLSNLDRWPDPSLFLSPSRSSSRPLCRQRRFFACSPRVYVMSKPRSSVSPPRRGIIRLCWLTGPQVKGERCRSLSKDEGEEKRWDTIGEDGGAKETACETSRRRDRRL